MGILGGLGARLYSGQSSYDFVGRRRMWYAVAGVLLIIAVGALIFRGLNLGVEFKGGAVFTVSNPTCSIVQARDAAEGVIGSTPTVTETGAGLIRVQTEPLDQASSNQVIDALAQVCETSTADVAVQLVGPSWGGEITTKALQGLLVFLVLVAVFLSIYFEWRMAVAALVALVQDVVITIGIYALTGLQVTPATVVGLLTILSFSLYDTVVVFDMVKEETRGITAQSMRTYGETANHALNQVLVRSINTTITSVIPVFVVIIVGAGLLGAGTLLDLAVALAIGMTAGTFSSIFIATPLLVQLKERQPDIKSLAVRVHARRAGQARAASSSASEQPGESMEGQPSASLGETTIIAGPRSQPKRPPRSKRSGAK